MIYTLSNELLSVRISDMGAEVQSVVAKSDGCEYIWQGDPKYWEGRAPVLFPVCGRFLDNTYTYREKKYQMGLHGFAADCAYEVKAQNATAITFSLKDNETTRAQYPFAFEFDVTYRLERDVLTCEVAIVNCGNEIMPATFGAHPGFNVPLVKGADFESYYLRFGKTCSPNRLQITPNGHYTGKQHALALEDGDTLRLHHELFVSDGIFMSRMADSVTLCSDKDPHAVTVSYSGFPYLGIWQEYGADTPFICIEPWCGMASYDGVIEDLEKKCDMFHLPAGGRQELSYSIRFH